MDQYLLNLARGKKVTDAMIIEVITLAQPHYNELENLYDDIKDLHKTHARKKKQKLGGGDLPSSALGAAIAKRARK